MEPAKDGRRTENHPLKIQNLKSKIQNPHALLAPWERLVETKPREAAVVELSPDRIWTFREIDGRARELEARLREMPLRLRGLPIGFRERNGGDWIARFLALLRIGAPALPLDVSIPDAGARGIAEQCGAAWWNDEANLRLPERPRRFRSPAIAVLKLTSGTTGAPKPLPFRAEEMAADGRQILEGMKIGPEERNFAVIPFGHSYGLGNLVMPLLLAGVPVACGSSPLPHVLADEFCKSGASALPAVPTIFSALVQAKVELPTLELAISAGAPLRPELAKAFFALYGKPLHNFFGSSETGGIAFDPDGSAGVSGRAIGTPLPGVSIGLTIAGRIRVSSAAVFTRGNRRRANGFGEIALPDFGRINEHGELVLRGRAGRMIKIGARRFDLSEIERALEEDPRVRLAWATALSGDGEERAAAVAESKATAAELRQSLRRKLPNWKMPRTLLVVERLPVTGRGKPDREQLLQLLLP